MAEVNLRLIGGQYDGQTHKVNENAPVLYLAVKHKMDYAHCAPGSEIVMPAEVEVERYIVKQMRFDEGLDHHYGITEPLQFVDVMNCMWDAYSTAMRAEQKR